MSREPALIHNGVVNFSSILDMILPDQVTPFGISIFALVVSLASPIVAFGVGLRSTRLARQSNSSKILIDLFEEHRQPELAEARHYIHHVLPNFDEAELRTKGLSCLPDEDRKKVRDLMWLYDHIGLLVAYGFTRLEPVAAYLGGSVVDTWAKVEPIVDGERKQRSVAESADPLRYQLYFQSLAEKMEGIKLKNPKRLIKRRRRLHVLRGSRRIGRLKRQLTKDR